VEAAPFLGAGVRTQWHGGHPYTFGPRHFLTQNEKVYEFLDSFLPLRLCSEHEFITYVEQDNSFYNFPINRDDIPKMPEFNKIQQELKELHGVEEAQNLEEYWLRSVGPTLYKKFIDDYSKKMWQVSSNTTLDTFKWSPKGVALKEGPRAAWDVAISAYPWAPNGYDDYFEIATQGTEVLVSTKIQGFDIPNKRVLLNDTWLSFDIIVNTISPDSLFDNCFGSLPFIGRDLFKVVLPMEFCFPDNVYFIYYANQEPFTRLVEYKRFTLHKAPNTLVGMEIPSTNGKHYPVPTQFEQARARKYLELMPEGVFSIGRAGSYDYGIDIDNCIEQAMGIAEKLS
jgi:UDP-galactopyranose mutase